MVMNKSNSLVFPSGFRKQITYQSCRFDLNALQETRKLSNSKINSPSPPCLFARVLTPEIPLIRETPAPKQVASDKTMNFVQILKKSKSGKNFLVLPNFELVGKKVPHFSVSSPFSVKNLGVTDKKNLQINKNRKKAEPSVFRQSIVKKIYQSKKNFEKVYCKSDRPKKVLVKKVEEGIGLKGDVLRERKVSFSIEGWDGNSERG
jgi:hypothetical protein